MTMADAPVARRTGPARQVVARGVAWNSIFEVVQSAVALGVMLVMVRLVAPGDYGRAAAAAAVQRVIAAFSAEAFAHQALQLPAGETPDWSEHWRAGLRVNGTLFLMTCVVGFALYSIPAWHVVAPLVLVGGFGLLFALPHTLAMLQFQRALDFRAYRTAQFISQLTGQVGALCLALAGWGAMALVVGTTVLHLVPISFWFLVVRRWRPAGSWFGAPHWARYRPSMQFGAQAIGATLLTNARSSLEGATLPAAVGFAPLGLLGRAGTLFQQTAARAGQVLLDSVYPLLPRVANDPPTFRRQAGAYLQAALLVTIPSAIFLLLEGRTVSRFVFGPRWIAADPLLAACTITGAATLIFNAAKSVPFAQSQLRVVFLLNLTSALLAGPTIVVALLTKSVNGYAWAAAGAQSVVAIASLIVAERALGRGAWGMLLAPALSASLAVAASVGGIGHVWPSSGLWIVPAVRSIALTLVGVMAAAIVLRTLHRELLRSLVGALPGGSRLHGLLRLEGAHG
jgi:O-antigen/teichoic acid export membrane protein